MMQKKCRKCQVVKSLLEFKKRSSGSKDGYSSICKKCHNIENKEYRKILVARDIIVYPAQKKCGSCEIVYEKPEEYFHRSKFNVDGLIWQCKLCASKYWRLQQFGLTDDMFQLMIENQNGLCAGCQEPLIDGRINIDHDHACCPGEKTCGNCVRGILCTSCNHGLGFYEKVLPWAANYLNKYKRGKE